jgi:hypothetical protein
MMTETQINRDLQLVERGGTAGGDSPLPPEQPLSEDAANYHFRPLSEPEQRRVPAVWRPLP